MPPLDRNLISEAVRLFEGRVVSAAEAEKLRANCESREEFLFELWLRRGALERSPDLAEAINRELRSRPPPRGGGDKVLYDKVLYEGLLTRLDPSEPTALYVPRWRGVAAATHCLFRQTIPIPRTADQHPDDIDAVNITAYADILLSSGVRHFVISGGDSFHLALIRCVLQQDPCIRFDLVWHANYLQLGEEGDWRLFQQWLRAHEDGLVTRIGLTKSGFDRVLRHAHVDAISLPQFLPICPEQFTSAKVANVAGIWLSGSSLYRKLPHVMIAAVKLMNSFYLRGAGLGADGLALVSALDVPFLQVLEDPLPRERLLMEIPETVVSLYVTISECSPMLPIESFSVGVPCLIGPSCHLFRDHEFLRRMLIVNQPYNAGVIAEMAQAAVLRREELLVAYRSYNKETEIQARAALSRFLT